MNDIDSTLSNNIPPWPGTGPCEPACECPVSKEALSIGLSLYAPVSSEPGSSSFFFLQPLLSGNVYASVAILIAVQIFLFLADRYFGHESVPTPRRPVLSPEQSVTMSVKDLQDFLASLPRENFQPSSGLPAGETNETAEIPVVLAISIWSTYTSKPYSPLIFLLFPVLTFPGVRGALPLLILELLATIFVRAVVPPQTTGSKPLTDPASKNSSQLLQFSPEELLKLLNRFYKHFGP